MTRYNYSIDDGTNTFHGTGTITVALAGTAVSGTGTSFTSQLAVGGILFTTGGAIIGSIASIASTTSLALTYGSLVAVTGGTFDYNNLINVENMTNGLPPKSVPKPWAQAFDLGDGLARGMGRPTTTWQFGFAQRAFRDALRVYCTGKAARVYIRSRGIDSADAYATYQAAMLWPDEETRDAGRRVPFALEFRDLVVI